ncbi:hypothetical protein [Geodermatophilus obscurus]|uniref:Uncharacterized protein n=1 Tax=Geodermatophilus obscurus (strain ATCC 25078 / DSM 43160 / JCM 3152 / CCUG 61914 / KCC A-0152 / KCTC 9177 / NBRC 13315 / NRRL B-3577 / G-20) TaxID=526225 RepID=D2S8I0_GEOOG|nr:hypothetical protein [Geodermatophilus obscurus]ADB75561.1 hypothetical protein Gobs_2944 [Geodermatophilus obscurus DSM 43160]
MSWSIYRGLWWASLLGALAHGLLGALRHLSVAGLLLIGGGMAAQGTVYGWLVWGGGAAPHLRTRTLGAALSYPVLTLSVFGLALIQGWGSLVIAAALCLAGLPLRYRARSCAAREGPVAAQAREPVGPPATILTEDLGTAELCRAWQITSAALQRVAHPRPVQMLVELRVEYLDELERRDPQGLTRWLAEAPAATDPTPFFPATAER